MKSVSIPLVLLAMASIALANTAPMVVIQSATMRPGTTLRDVVYRVNDPDDPTVKTRALAFVDGERSFAKVLRPVTFVEGTAAKLGDAIPANVDHTLTWDVAADWDIDLGQVMFEVLAMDGRGLLPFDWITIPATGENPEMTISKDSPDVASILDSLFWQYASGDPDLELANGTLRGNSNSGVFDGQILAQSNGIWPYGGHFILKRMNLSPFHAGESQWAYQKARVLLGGFSTSNLYVSRKPWTGITPLVSWLKEIQQPVSLSEIRDLAVADMGSSATFDQRTFIALMPDSSVFTWGRSWYSNMPLNGLKDVIQVSSSNYHAMALKADGTVVATSFQNRNGEANVPSGLTDVISIAAGGSNINEPYCLALKSDGTIVSWGNGRGGAPNSIPGAISIEEGVALKSDGTVIKWGGAAPNGMMNVVTLKKFMAIKSDGTRVIWTSIPSNLNPADIVALAPSVAILSKRL